MKKIFTEIDETVSEFRKESTPIRV